MTDGDSNRMTSLAIVVGGGTMGSGSPRASCGLATQWPESGTITGRDRTQAAIDAAAAGALGRYPHDLRHWTDSIG
jgi:hypothetical protein